MNTVTVLREIAKKVKEEPSIPVLFDYLAMIREGTKYDDSCKIAVSHGKKLSDLLEKMIPVTEDIDEMKTLYRIHEQVLLAIAPFDFDAYCLYIEWDREPKSKFYAPRRKQLRPLADFTTRTRLNVVR